MTEKRPTKKAPAKAGVASQASDYEARLDAAWKATEEIVLANPDRVADPTLPYFQVAAEAELDAERLRYEAGEKIALMGSIRICANHSIALPEWAARAFISGYDTVLNCRSNSWDEVFGKPYKKGLHLASLRKRRVNRIRVYLAVRNRGERPIDEQLFEEVGKPLGIGKTLAAELYYEAKGRMKI